MNKTILSAIARALLFGAAVFSVFVLERIDTEISELDSNLAESRREVEYLKKQITWEQAQTTQCVAALQDKHAEAAVLRYIIRVCEEQSEETGN